MAAPLGNKNAVKAKLWENAIKRALARRANGTIDDGLDELADKLVSQAAGGEQWAILEVGNRLDGKPAQAVALTDPDGEALQLKVEFVRAGTSPVP